MSESKQNDFLKLYEPIHDQFERFCRARVYGDMEFRDLINETLLVAYEKFDTLKSHDAFLSFLFGISVRLLANNKRKRKEVAVPSQEELNRHRDLNADTATKTEVYLLHKALAMLPEIQRECVILFEISGFSIKEIAVLQESSESAIKQRLKRGRDKLAEILTFESSTKTGDL
jgi:RNA polymerase sigma-70 factor (ECF subfamily)